ncbi:MAG: nuclear transport factor 2 family protein [Betaproteobacteria bacterium]
MSAATGPALAAADPALVAEVEAYFAVYARAYDTFDAAAIADHFALPSYILHPDRDSAGFTTREALAANMERINEINRTHRFGRATFGPISVAAFAPTLVLATVPWAIHDVEGALLWRFTCTYNLAKRANGWKILVCTNHTPDD